MPSKPGTAIARRKDTRPVKAYTPPIGAIEPSPAFPSWDGQQRMTEKEVAELREFWGKYEPQPEPEPTQQWTLAETIDHLKNLAWPGDKETPPPDEPEAGRAGDETGAITSFWDYDPPSDEQKRGPLGWLFRSGGTR